MKQRVEFIFWCLLAPLLLFPLASPFSFSVDKSELLLKRIPLEIGQWKGQDFPLEQRTYEILETRNVLSRRYVSPTGKKIDLLIVSSERDRRVAHPPEVCYLSSNFTILNEKKGAMTYKGEAIPVKEFVALDKKDANHAERVVYVYKVGPRYTTSYFHQQLQFAWDRMTRRESQILLIRLAGPEEGPFQEFLPQVLPFLS